LWEFGMSEEVSYPPLLLLFKGLSTTVSFS
jgi:hypothetical protein